eukprot:COSAG05_NODE_1159_length_5667_cov_13.925467_2_plen_137_part_00
MVVRALGKRGYHFASGQSPPCVHLALTLRHTGEVMDQIVAALEDAVAEVRATPPPLEEEGVGIYGSEGGGGSATGTSEREEGEAFSPKDAALHSWLDRTLDLPPDGYYEARAAKKKADAEVPAVVTAGASGRRARL